jgi:secreted PhoX family phosphatase
VEWVTIDDPDPETDTVRVEGQSKGAVAFARAEGCWIGDGRVYFACTTGGEARLGQLWEYEPGGADDDRRGRGRGPDRGDDDDGDASGPGGTLTLVYESANPDDLQSPQQGGRGVGEDEASINAEGALTYAIWAPFERGGGNGRGPRDDDRGRRDRDDDEDRRRGDDD